MQASTRALQGKEAATRALQGKEAADDERATHALRGCTTHQQGATLTRPIPTRTLGAKGAKEAAAEHAREKLQARLHVSSE